MHKETVRSHLNYAILLLKRPVGLFLRCSGWVRLAMTKGDDTRREIVEKAAPLFNQKGFEGTSMSDLMRVTGLQKGGIYRHFSSKEELASEAFDYAWQKAVERRLEGVDEA